MSIYHFTMKGIGIITTMFVEHKNKKEGCQRMDDFYTDDWMECVA